MRSKWKLGPMLLVPLLALLTAGCSGINQSVTPGQVLPFLIHHVPQPATPEVPTGSSAPIQLAARVQ